MTIALMLYNIHMSENDGTIGGEKIAGLFSQLSQPARIQILLVISEQPACVCHLIAALGLRQAAISQHLMALRSEGWVKSRRHSRFIYYRLADKRLLPLIRSAAEIAGISWEEMVSLSRRPLENCPCPQCNPNQDPDHTCTSITR
jgi:ArsR family transcriptional regulator